MSKTFFEIQTNCLTEWTYKTTCHPREVNFESDEWVCKVAKTLGEATALVEAGFEYVTEMDGIKIFRKRK